MNRLSCRTYSLVSKGAGTQRLTPLISYVGVPDGLNLRRDSDLRSPYRPS